MPKERVIPTIDLSSTDPAHWRKHANEARVAVVKTTDHPEQRCSGLLPAMSDWRSAWKSNCYSPVRAWETIKAPYFVKRMGRETLQLPTGILRPGRAKV